MFFSTSIFLLFFFVPVHSSSYSFVNLIPNILANGRSVINEQVDPNSLFNNTSPTFHFDRIPNLNQSNCREDLQVFYRDLSARKLWAIKTLDSWGKIPSGILQGNIFWLGSVYECQHHLRGWNRTVVEQPIRTHTCTIGNGISSNKIQPIYGLCVPQTCNASDITDYLHRGLIRISFIERWINVSAETVRCLESRQFDSGATFTIILLIVIVLLVLIATGLHLAYESKMNRTVVDVSPAINEPLWSRTTTANPTALMTATDEREQSTVSDEATPLVDRSPRSIDYVAQTLINSCSFLNSYKIFTSDNYPKNLACLNGIRVLSFFWIVLGHTIVFAVFYSDNAMTIFNWSREFWFQIIVQTLFSIDSFFLLNGLLTSFSYFISKGENERFSCWKFLLNHYVYHYLRYTLLYAVVLLVYITLSPYLSSNSPIYPIDGIESTTCRKTWWRNLLYINNFFDLRDSCMPVTWFLAVFVQFQWISPLFLFVVSWKWLLGMLVAFLFILTDILSTSIIVSKKNYEHGLLSDFYSNNSFGPNLTSGYLNDVYIKPYCRLSPYAVGLAMGYIFYEVYQRSNIVQWSSTGRTNPLTRSQILKQIFIWTVALLIIFLCVFGTYGDYNGHDLSRSSRIAFLVLSRLGWSVGLSIIIAACFVGYGGIINQWLSQSYFYKLAKLTYGAFLWHTLIIFVNYFGRDQPTHYTITNLLFHWICFLILSYFFAFFSAIFIEFPIVQMLKSSFKRTNPNCA